MHCSINYPECYCAFIYGSNADKNKTTQVWRLVWELHYTLRVDRFPPSPNAINNPYNKSFVGGFIAPQLIVEAAAHLR